MRGMRLAAFAIVFVLAWMGEVRGAGLLNDAFQQVDTAGWGATADVVKRAAADTPLYETPSILITQGNFGNRPLTLNYLFNKNGGLYNMAWYTTISVREINVARDFNKKLQDALRAKYGKPAYAFADGDARKSRNAEKLASRRAEVEAKLAKAQAAQGGAKLTPEEVKKITGGLSPMDMIPTIFYSNLAFWDGGKVWAYTNLLCSTDGACYLHLQFVSKDQTRGEEYFPTPGKPFSYSPLDRDQDLVTESNSAMAATK